MIRSATKLLSSLRSLGALAVAVAAVAGACSAPDGAGGFDEPVQEPATSSTLAATSSSDDGPDPPVVGAATWPLVDAVSGYTKPGLLVRGGLDYVPMFDDTGAQVAARLVFRNDQAMFAVLPQPSGTVDFDQIQLAGIAMEGGATARVWPFVVVDHTLTAFADEEDLNHCVTAVEAGLDVESFGLSSQLGEHLVSSTGSCLALNQSEGIRIGQMGTRWSEVKAFGVLFELSDFDPSREIAATLEWLALGDSTQPLDEATGEPFTITIESFALALASRTADPDDDASLAELHVLTSDGTASVVSAISPGIFELNSEAVSGWVKLWFADYGLQHYARQGPWLDLTRLTRDLVIDLSPEYELSDEPPLPSNRSSRPHDLGTWNGSRSMARQEYQGLTFTNNDGQADRDRLAEPSNDCTRVGYLGGSFVEALQTRVDQKPGIIAESLLWAEAGTCVEVLTVAQDTFTVENHYANARHLVEDLGVELLIFSISNLELCRMDDLVYANSNGVDPTTPVRWRLVDGEIIEPVSRRNALDFDADPAYQIRERCDFGGLADSEGAVEASIMEKLNALVSEIGAFGGGTPVVFVNVKDVVLGIDQAADGVERLCNTVGLDCWRLLVDGPSMKPDELADDFNQHLLRYAGDGHPTVQANQVIARLLVDIIRTSLLA